MLLQGEDSLAPSSALARKATLPVEQTEVRNAPEGTDA